MWNSSWLIKNSADTENLGQKLESIGESAFYWTLHLSASTFLGIKGHNDKINDLKANFH